MNNNKVSFIVISYNEAKYINDAINSILDLNCKYDYEIIIGDDGSNDGSIDIIKEYQNKYPEKIKYFVMDREKGITSKDVIGAIRCSNVIKKGIDIATGDYILILSADDYYVDKKFVNTAINYMDNNEEYVALIHDGYNLNKNKKNEYFDYPNELFWCREYIHVSNFFMRNTKEFQNSLLDNFCDDIGMLYSILALGKVKFKNDKVHEYRINENGIMKSSDFIEHMLMELMFYQDILNKNLNKLKNSSFRRFYTVFINLYHDKDKLNEDKYKKYRDYFDKFENNIYDRMIKSSLIDRMTFMIKSYILVIYFYIWRKLYR